MHVSRSVTGWRRHNQSARKVCGPECARGRKTRLQRARRAELDESAAAVLPQP